MRERKHREWWRYSKRKGRRRVEFLREERTSGREEEWREGERERCTRVVLLKRWKNFIQGYFCNVKWF